MKKSYTKDQLVVLAAEIAAHYNTDVVTTRQINDYVKSVGKPTPWGLMIKANQVSWGKYRVAGTVPADVAAVKQAPAIANLVVAIKNELKVKTLADSFIPERDETYVPFGFFNDLRGILQSGIFYPVYITGLSGNGKTLMVDQVCAEIGRELIRVNITKETDETDLIGSYELIDGNTVWRDGPVLVAMKRGAVLLLDETDYGSERLLCLQPVLEGKGYFNKKRGEFISPAHGFNICATANTKGKGSDDGRFIGANVLNEAFLERFAITVEQEYPAIATEIKILENLFKQLKAGPELRAKEFSKHLAKWGELIRKTQADGGVDEVISTRRLTHIAKAFVMFRNKRKAIELCLNRFDDEVKTTYLDFYTKIDMNIDTPIPPAGQPTIETVAIKSEEEMDFSIPVAGMTNPAPPLGGRKAPVDPGASKPTASTPIPAPPVATVPRQTATFGSPIHLAQITRKYKTKIGLKKESNGGYTISNDGQSSRVGQAEVNAATYDVLDKYVSLNQKMAGQAVSANTEDDDF